MFPIAEILIIAAALTYIVSDIKDYNTIRYISKPLATLLVIFVALYSQNQSDSLYKNLILSGLVLSLAGDVFLMLRKDMFLQGLISFFIAHIFFIIAISLEFGFGTNIYLLIIPLIYALIVLWKLFPSADKLKIPLIAYSLMLVIFLWQSANLYYLSSTNSAAYAFYGSLFFIISDTFLAFAKFKRKRKYSTVLIHTTYWFAIYLLAISA